MSDNDKLKDLLKSKLKREFKKPTNEWNEIMSKIEQEDLKTQSWLNFPSLAKISLVALCMTLFVIFNPLSSQNNGLSDEEKIELSSFLMDNHLDFEEDDESDDYTYLALID